MLVSFVVAFLNEELNLRAAYNEIKKMETLAPDVDYEIVLVDDGSVDRSWEIARALVASDARVHAIRLTRNFGAINAVMAGIAESRGDYVCDYAADSQDPIELFAELLRHNIESGHELAWGVRKSRRDSIIAKVLSKAYAFLMGAFAIPDFPAEGLDTFCISRKLADFLVKNYDPTSSMLNLLFWAHFDSGRIEYHRRERTAGRSKWSLGKKFNLFVNSFVSFSHAPLRFVTTVGFLFAAAGFAWGLYIVLYALFYNFPVAGFASIMALVLFGFGMTNLSLGIISEYVWRVFALSKRQPYFVVAERVSGK